MLNVSILDMEDVEFELAELDAFIAGLKNDEHKLAAIGDAYWNPETK